MKKQIILILILLLALLGLKGALIFCTVGKIVPEFFMLQSESLKKTTSSEFLQNSDQFSSDEAFLSGGVRTLQAMRSGGMIHPFDQDGHPIGCEAIRMSADSVPEHRGITGIPDSSLQILCWLVSTLEIRAGPCVVCIG